MQSIPKINKNALKILHKKDNGMKIVDLNYVDVKVEDRL